MLPGIIEAVEAGEMKISSLHNFCPLPMGVTHAAPNLYLFSSADQRERENAWRHSMKTLETAARLKAQVVVLHLGCIDMKDYTDKLIEMVGKGQKDTPKYQKLCNELMEKREEKKQPYVERSAEMLGRLADEAEKRGLRLGCENREGLEEIPLEDDFQFLLREFDRPGVGYCSTIAAMRRSKKTSASFPTRSTSESTTAEPPHRISHPRRGISRPRPSLPRHRLC